MHRHDDLFMHQLLTEAERHANVAVQTDDLEQEIHELETAIVDMEKDLHGIQELGCILRNVNTGTVDFLGNWKGKAIYFCWKKGEKAVHYYHSLKSDRTDRQPLEGGVS